MAAQSPKLDTLQQLELVDGVEVELRIAGPFARGRAWVIDLLIKGGLLTVYSLLVTLLGFLIGFDTAGGLMLLGAFVIVFFYHVLLEAGEKGATWGKRMCGLQVVTTSGGRLGLGRATVRNLLRLADMQPVFILGTSGALPSFAMGLICCLFTRRFQRVGDLVAGSVVVYTREYFPSSPGQFRETAEERPPVPLKRDEEKALLEYLERGPSWSDGRKVELADHLAPVTGETGVQGAQRVIRMANWLQSDRKGGGR